MEKNLAVARGEALAAKLLTEATLRAVLMALPNRLEVVGSINAFMDEMLNRAGPGTGDAHD
jgi:hypothetical protein